MPRKLPRVNENEHANLQSDIDDVPTIELNRGPLKDKYGVLPPDQTILLSQPYPPIQSINRSSSTALSYHNITNEPHCTCAINCLQKQTLYAPNMFTLNEF
jgi:hypothetical protein